MQKNKDFIDIYGIHAVKAALKNIKRNHKKLIITPKIKEKIDPILLKNVKKVIQLPMKEIISIYGNEFNHQGIILQTTNLIQPSLEEIINLSINKKEIIVMLDQVNDPNNIGSIMRSCSMFNCKAIIVSKDNAPDITPSLAKSASGALEMVSYIKVTNLVRAIKIFKKNNFWAVGLNINNNNKFQNKFVLPKRCLLILGSESKGLRNLTIKECDELQTIPVNKNNKYNIESLNVSNACSIGLYNHYSQN